MKPKIIKGKTLKEYNKKYGKIDTLEVLSETQVKKKPELLGNKKWWLIGSNYYQVPKKKYLIPIFASLGVLAVTAAVVTPLALKCVNDRASTPTHYLTYNTTNNKYESSDIAIKAKSKIIFNIKIGESLTSNGVVVPQTFSIVKDGSSDLVSIKKIDSVTIKGVAYKGFQLLNNNTKVDLGDLTDEGLVKDDIVKVELSTANESDIAKAKATCEPYVESYHLDISANKPFTLSVSAKNWTSTGTLQYSNDGGSIWNTWDGSDSVTSSTIAGKHNIYLRGKDITSFASKAKEENATTFKFAAVDPAGDSLQVYLNGNIMRLLDYENPPTTIPANYCFYNLFNNCTSLVSLPRLPATTLTTSCYSAMFNGCTGITSLPEKFLPATTLAESCYLWMFSGCTGLTTLPEKLLPALNLAKQCYTSMFAECTGITSLPAGLLPATNLAINCYYVMFASCSQLKSTPNLPAKDLKYEKCYFKMFEDCTSLTKIGKFANGEELAISAEGVSASMFHNCSNLKVVEWVEGESEDSKFMKIGSVTGCEHDPALNMFGDCKSGSIATPEVGKFYKYVIE